MIASKSVKVLFPCGFVEATNAGFCIILTWSSKVIISAMGGLTIYTPSAFTIALSHWFVLQSTKSVTMLETSISKVARVMSGELKEAEPNTHS